MDGSRRASSICCCTTTCTLPRAGRPAIASEAAREPSATLEAASTSASGGCTQGVSQTKTGHSRHCRRCCSGTTAVHNSRPAGKWCPCCEMPCASSQPMPKLPAWRTLSPWCQQAAQARAGTAALRRWRETHAPPRPAGAPAPAAAAGCTQEAQERGGGGGGGGGAADTHLQSA